jgi:hypothetical protein
MSLTKLNAEELAAKRFGIGAWIVHWTPTDAYATAIREVAQPIADERDEYRKVLQWLDNWLGGKPMPECSEKIRAILAKYPKP